MQVYASSWVGIGLNVKYKWGEWQIKTEPSVPTNPCYTTISKYFIV